MYGHFYFIYSFYLKDRDHRFVLSDRFRKLTKVTSLSMVSVDSFSKIYRFYDFTFSIHFKKSAHE